MPEREAAIKLVFRDTVKRLDVYDTMVQQMLLTQPPINNVSVHRLLMRDDNT